MNQTDLVRTRLLATGRVDAFEAIFQGIGGVHPTRLAAIIHTLRHRDGWTIDTIEEPGKLATYVLRDAPGHAPSPAVPQPVLAFDPEDLERIRQTVRLQRDRWEHRRCGHVTLETPKEDTGDPDIRYGTCPGCGRENSLMVRVGGAR